MSKVTIPNRFKMESTLVITPSDGDTTTPEVHVHVTGGGLPMLNTRRTDFIAGVEEALDGTFIEHSTLPKVTVAKDDPCYVEVDGQAYLTEGLYSPGDREYFEKQAKRSLALLRWIDANQPVIDQEQVDAFAEALSNADFGDEIRRTEVATDIVRAGYKITKEV